MKTKLVLLALTISVCLNVFMLLSSNGDEKLIVASNSQLKCLESWKGIKNKTPVYGPEIFKEHYVVSLKDVPVKSFKYEAGGCFYDSISLSATPEQLSSRIEHIESRGFNEFYFYKSPNNKNVFDIYAIRR